MTWNCRVDPHTRSAFLTSANEKKECTTTCTSDTCFRPLHPIINAAAVNHTLTSTTARSSATGKKNVTSTAALEACDAALPSSTVIAAKKSAPTAQQLVNVIVPSGYSIDRETVTATETITVSHHVATATATVELTAIVLITSTTPAAKVSHSSTSVKAKMTTTATKISNTTSSTTSIAINKVLVNNVLEPTASAAPVRCVAHRFVSLLVLPTLPLSCPANVALI